MMFKTPTGTEFDIPRWKFADIAPHHRGFRPTSHRHRTGAYKGTVRCECACGPSDVLGSGLKSRRAH
jgi:hypothetical protein